MFPRKSEQAILQPIEAFPVSVIVLLEVGGTGHEEDARRREPMRRSVGPVGHEGILPRTSAERKFSTSLGSAAACRRLLSALPRRRQAAALQGTACYTSPRMPKISLTTKIFIGLFLGILIGWIAPKVGITAATASG